MPVVRAEAPRPSLEIEGTSAAALEARLLALEIRHVRDEPSRCRVHLSNWGAVQGGAVGLLDADIDRLTFGRALDVALRPDPPGGVLFRGRITAIEAVFSPEGPPALIVEAEDALFDLRAVRRTRRLTDMTIPDAIRHVAEAHGLEAEVTASADGPEPELVQVDQRDLDFVVALAHRLDAWVWAEDRRLMVAPRGANRGRARTFSWPKGLAAFHARADLGRQTTRTTVAGWDPGAKAPVHAVAGPEETGAGQTGVRTGAYYAETAFGARPRWHPASAVRRVGEAAGLARHLQRERARRFVTGEGVLATPSALEVGAGVTLKGTGGAFDGAHHLVAVTHEFSAATGLVTRFATERPFLGTPSRRRPGDAG